MHLSKIMRKSIRVLGYVKKSLPIVLYIILSPNVANVDLHGFQYSSADSERIVVVQSS